MICHLDTVLSLSLQFDGHHGNSLDSQHFMSCTAIHGKEDSITVMGLLMSSWLSPLIVVAKLVYCLVNKVVYDLFWVGRELDCGIHIQNFILVFTFRI